MRKYGTQSPVLLAHIQRRRLQKRRVLTESRESERRFREAIHFLPIPVGISDRRGRMLAHNQMFTDVFGYTIQDIPTVEDWLKRAYPDESYRQQVLATWQADVELVLGRGMHTPARIYQVTCKDGSRCLVEIITQPAGDLLATTFNDVTARKQAEESQRLFKSLVENSSDAIGMSTPEGQHYYQNEAFSRLFGEIGDYPPDTLYVDREVGRQVFATTMAGGQWVGEVKMYARDKSIRDIFLRAYPNVDDDGKTVGLVGIHTDVTERRRMEDALRENEVIFSSFLEHSPVYVFFKDKNVRSLRLSKNYEQMLGMPIDVMLGKTMDELFPSELAKSMVADDLRILNEGQPVHVVEELDGRMYETTKFPIFKDGKPDMLAGFTLDITDRVRAERALRESEARYRALFERANDAIFIEDREDRIIDVNHRACELLGYTREELLQMRVPDLIAPEMGRRKRTVEEEFILYGSRPFESLDVRKDGVLIPVEVTNASLPNGLALSIVRDITARKQSESRIRESEALLRVLINSMPDIVCFKDGAGRWLEANEFDLMLFELTEVDYRGKKDSELAAYSPFYRDAFLACEDSDEKAWQAGDISRGEEVIPRPDGSVMVFDIIKVPTFAPSGERLGLIVVGRDITERKQIEAALRESERRFRILFEHAGAGVAQIDSITGQFLRVNQKYCDIVGYTRQEMQRLDFQSITHPDDLQTDLDQMERLKKGQIPEFTLEKRYFRKDGSLVWVHLIVSPLWRPGQPPDTHIAVVHDITERKRAENELRESEKRFRVLFENVGVGVAQGDSNTGRFLKVNQKYGAILGYSREEMENIDFPSITYPDDLPKNLDLLEQLKRGEIPEFTMEKRYIRKDGTLVWVLLTVSPLWNPGEPPSTHITVVHDITEQKRAEYALRYSEAEIRKLNTELERRVAERTIQLEVANKELEAFAYSVSHDLRAPLRAIDGFSRIFINEYAGELNTEARELIDKVRSANDSMSQLVDALLGLSRMTRAEIHRESIDLSALAHSILEALSREQPEREVEWLVADQAIADGDSRLLRVVLENLLGNAWKFTSKNERARIEFGMETRAGETVYFVRDNGAGFNSRYADKLFGAFQRLHRSDEFEGTGIGLATVQRIIHRHGGRIWAESELGKGATFYFVLG